MKMPLSNRLQLWVEHGWDFKMAMEYGLMVDHYYLKMSAMIIGMTVMQTFSVGMVLYIHQVCGDYITVY
jgi:hypothetical protein